MTIWKILIQSFTDVENVETFNYTVLKNPFHQYHHWSHQESLEAVEKCQACSGKFSKILLFAWKLKFYQWQKICYFSLTWQAYFIHFQENFYQIFKSRVYLSSVLSNKDSLSQRKPLVQLRTQSRRCFALRQPLFSESSKCFVWFWFLQKWHAGPLCSCGVQASHCGGLSCCRARVLGRAGFGSCGLWALKCSLSSSGLVAFCGLRDLPRPRIKSVSLALADGPLTTEPPGELIKDILKLPFSFLPTSGTKQCNDYSCYSVALPWFVLGAISFTHFCFCTSSANVSTVTLMS